MATKIDKEALKWEKKFKYYKNLESKRSLNDYEKNQLRHARNQLAEIPKALKKQELKIGKERLKLAKDIEYDTNLLSKFNPDSFTGKTDMNSRQLAGQYKSIQKRLGINQSKWNQIDFNEGNAKFDNQSNDMRFSSPEGRYVFKDDKTQLEFDSNLAKMKIPSLPNFNVGVDHEAEGTTEKSDGSVIDNTYQPSADNNTTISGIQQNAAKAELAIDKPKKYNQKLLDAGFKTEELDKLRIQHDSWKAARASGTLGDWEAKNFPDRTPRYKNRNKKNKNKNKKKP